MNNFDEYENKNNETLDNTEPNQPLQEQVSACEAEDMQAPEPMEVRKQHSITQEQHITQASQPQNTNFTMVDDTSDAPSAQPSEGDDLHSDATVIATDEESLAFANKMSENHFTSENEQEDEVNKEPMTAHKKGKRRETKSFMQQHKRGSIYAGCFLLALVGGFGGTLGAQYVGKKLGTNGTVLYQSVNTGKSGGSDVNATNMSVKDVANSVSDCVVEIKTESVATNSFFQQAVQSGAGSGVILSEDGYIVTNNHVIDGASKIQVTTKDGTSYEAKLIGTDPTTDLAVLKVEATDLKAAVLGTSGNLEVGDTAIAIGNPLGELGGTVTSGIISALDREITVDNQKMHLLQTSAAINPGNSGGGLFNDQGELIGVVNAKSSGESIEGLGFAIPIDRAKSIIENLMQNGYVKGRAALGVSLTEATSTNPFSSDQTAQVFIAKVESGKAADKAGLKVGDQILKVNDEDVTSVSDVKSAISTHTAGDKVTIVVLRDNETQSFDVTLGEADTTAASSNQNEEAPQQDIEERIPQSGLFH